MRTYSLYYSGSKKKTFPHEPSAEHIYADFIQVMYSSGYIITKSKMTHFNKTGFVEIEVTGVK